MSSSPLNNATKPNIHVLEIDGSYGEGGGQIVRNAGAYAALLYHSRRHPRYLERRCDDTNVNDYLGRPVVLHLTHIRSNRSRPGLQRQHLISLQLLADLVVTLTQHCDDDSNSNDGDSEHQASSILQGDVVGSQEILFGRGAHELLAHQSSIAKKIVKTEKADGIASGFGNQRKRFKRGSSLGQGQQLQPRRPPQHGRLVTSRSGEGKIRQFTGDTQTAGSICLLLQAVLPYALLHVLQHPSNCTAAPSSDSIELLLKGGTNATMAPQYDYFEHVFLPTLKQCCQLDDNTIQTQLVQRGFYPHGGGQVRVTVRPRRTKLQPIILNERGHVVDITIRSISGGKCPKSVATAMAKAAEDCLKTVYFPNQSGETAKSSNITTIVEACGDQSVLGSGSSILIVATTSTGCRLAGSAIGSPKVAPRISGQRAATDLIQCLQMSCHSNHDKEQEMIFPCVDEHLQDQLILYTALCDGLSEIVIGPLTLHTRTAIWLAEQVFSQRDAETDGENSKRNQPTPLFEVTRLSKLDESDYRENEEGTLPGLHLIRCHGIGYGL